MSKTERKVNFDFTTTSCHVLKSRDSLLKIESHPASLANDEECGGKQGCRLHVWLFRSVCENPSNLSHLC